jgi:hypothetical protein
MSRVLLRKTAAFQYSPLLPHCVGCAGCNTRSDSVHLPGVEGESIALELAQINQLRVIWNSLLKPLLLFVLTALCCSLFEVSESVAIVLSVVAFAIGIIWCQVVPDSSLNVIKVSSD